MLELYMEKEDKTYSFNDDLPYGELMSLGKSSDKDYSKKLVCALSYSPKLTIEDLDKIPSKTVLKMLVDVIQNYTADFTPAPKKKEE